MTELKPCGMGDNHQNGYFYSDNDLEIEESCLSSKAFQKFLPMETKDQLVICSESRQLIFYIPCSSSFDRSEQQALKKCLLKTSKSRPNNMNKLSKKRRINAAKWAFAGLKFSSFENPLSSKSPPGVTKVSCNQ